MRSLVCPLSIALLSLILLPTLGAAATTAQTTDFIATAKSRAKTPEALEALRNGPNEEFYRWGEELCNWVRSGKASTDQAQENLAEFFGPDLASALAFAARKHICPDLR